MKIPIEKEYKRRFHDLIDQVLDSNFLSEGEMVQSFESDFSDFLGGGVKSVAVCNGGSGLLALLEAANVEGGEVIVPSNTFMATPLAVQRAGGKVIFADCNREDLCLSLSDLKKRITSRTKAAIVVHIGGHIAFEIEEIADFLRDNGIPLIEDCAHAHGASYKGGKAGTYGLGGAYSFYATKTMPLGEGGMIVTQDERIHDFVSKWRNYGKFEYEVSGFNARMNEITAALGIVQLERLPKILEWKKRLAEKYDSIFKSRVFLPPGMTSGYYKYIVYDTKLSEETGKVFDRPCHEIMKMDCDLPATDWVKDHHACPPIYYGWNFAELGVDELAKKLIVE